MALESCKGVLLKTKHDYFHKGSKDYFTDGWRYDAFGVLFEDEDYVFGRNLIDDEDPCFLMPINLLNFNNDD